MGVLPNFLLVVTHILSDLEHRWLSSIISTSLSVQIIVSHVQQDVDNEDDDNLIENGTNIEPG